MGLFDPEFLADNKIGSEVDSADQKTVEVDSGREIVGPKPTGAPLDSLSAYEGSSPVADDPPRDLFGNYVEPWRDHWRGMPEFVQEDLTPKRTIYVHFERDEDVEEFARLVEQTITPLTKSIWYPQAEIGRFAHKRWVDGEDPSGSDLRDEEFGD